jgi:hypothetical protein
MNIYHITKLKLDAGEQDVWRMHEKLGQSAVWYDIFVNCNWVDTWSSSTVHIHSQTKQNTQQET